ncbi:MAG TPA: glycosyltransferase family 1 protein [Parvularculaceae bacterium]|nr:glycosyltransferase family 1 protein [Parvularculaceae bacterium]
MMNEGPALVLSALDRPGGPEPTTEPLRAVVNAPSLQPLRVAIFAGNYNYVMDGPVRALNLLVAHLLKRGHQALVFAPTTRTPVIDHAGELVSIPSVPLPGLRREYRLGLGLRGEARRRLDEFEPDLIHIAAPDITGLAALNYAEKRDIPVVASFHTRFDTYPRYYGARWLERHVTGYMRRFYARCLQVYPPSQSMADDLKRDGIGEDIRLWSRGVDSALFNPDKRDLAWRRSVGFGDDDIVILFVGRLVREKGIDVFAETVRRAASRNAKIKTLIVGDGPERANFENEMPDGVFVGYQDGEALARSYACADIFFNPSITEAFGNVTLEAMAAGVPAVCATASGSVSLVNDGATGYFSPPEAGPAGFLEKIEILAASPELRRRFGRAGRERALDFNWDVILDGLIANYRDAIMQKNN